MPTYDASGLKSDTDTASKAKANSILKPSAPFFFPAAFLEAEDFSPEWWKIVHSSPAFRDYWIHERMHYVYGEQLTAEDVDQLEMLVNFVNQDPKMMIQKNLNDFIQAVEAGGKGKQQDQEVVKSSKGV
ncbi:hypothetical protein O6H91_06G086900 [Diphasiastrum complanatum]|uniref:Uncharacterized protein n=1 Tax=Diphasiastrum complanatum TaxID=34168 RepID=A0ACC2DGI3_DIPCM|nr:hypothetical protein O6H91_06G086900 [Diphasiastrum complanatum]